MKTILVVSAFVLVACLSLEADALKRALQIPGPDGKLEPCKHLPDNLESRCVKYWCDNAQKSVSVLGCSLVNIKCKQGEVVDPGTELPDKVYPKCCPKPKCRPA